MLWTNEALISFSLMIETLAPIRSKHEHNTETKRCVQVKKRTIQLRALVHQQCDECLNEAESDVYCTDQSDNSERPAFRMLCISCQTQDNIRRIFQIPDTARLELIDMVG